MAGSNGNGHSLAKFILGLVIGGLGTSAGYIYGHGARLAVLETESARTQEQLQHINRKLDRLLDRPALAAK